METVNDQIKKLEAAKNKTDNEVLKAKLESKISALKHQKDIQK